MIPTDDPCQNLARMESHEPAQRFPLILDEYRRCRGAVDEALIDDAQRVFEALLAGAAPPADTQRAAGGGMTRSIAPCPAPSSTGTHHR